MGWTRRFFAPMRTAGLQRRRIFSSGAAGAVKEGDLVFAAGNPAPTARSTTAAQLTFYRDTALPLVLNRLMPRIQLLTPLTSKNDAAQAALTSMLSTLQNRGGKINWIARRPAGGAQDDFRREDPSHGGERIRRWGRPLAARCGTKWRTAYKNWAPV